MLFIAFDHDRNFSGCTIGAGGAVVWLELKKVIYACRAEPILIKSSCQILIPHNITLKM